MAVQSIVWHGKAITDRMKAAQIDGVNQTMGACVNHAKRNHTWQNQTGDLTRTIQVVRNAHPSGAFVVGRWGSTDVAYALIHEIGGTIVPKRAKFLTVPVTENAKRAGSPRNMPSLHFGKTKGGQPVLLDQSGRVQYLLRKKVTIPARPYLRPAADLIYPQLAANIRRAWKKYKPGSAAPATENSDG